MDRLRKNILFLLQNQASIEHERAKRYEYYIYSNSSDVNDYKSLAFEKLGEFVKVKGDAEKQKEIARDIKNNVKIWESSIYQKEKKKYENALDRSVKKPEAVKGVYICKDKMCGSDLFYMWSMQTRSGDEGMTHFRECAKCGKRGRC